MSAASAKRTFGKARATSDDDPTASACVMREWVARNRHVAAHDEAGDVVGLDSAGRETLDIVDHRQHQFLRRAAAELPVISNRRSVLKRSPAQFGAPVTPSVSSVEKQHFAPAVSSDALSLTVLNEPSAVPRAAEQVEAFCRDRNIPGPIAYKFNLAPDETLTNAISLAFADGGRHQIDVSVKNRDSNLTATVSDDGTPFDPLAHPPPDVHAAVEDARSAAWASTCCGR